VKEKRPKYFFVNRERTLTTSAYIDRTGGELKNYPPGKINTWMNNISVAYSCS
jgi:hypothetical protein